MTARPGPAEQAELYERWLWRGGALSDGTKRIYANRVKEFVAWLERDLSLYADATSDEHVRDFAVRDYRRKLLTVDKRKPATVAQCMAAIGQFYLWLEMGKPRGVAVDVTESDRMGLDRTDLRKLLRACRVSSTRNYAMASTLFYAGPRVEELVMLDVDDVHMTERTGTLSIRYGKGGKPRDVPLSKDLRPILREWMEERSTLPGADGPALFTSRNGERVAVRTVQHTLAAIGASVGIKVSPHVLRHTFGRVNADNNTDVESLRRMMGHKSIQTTAGYMRPSAATLQAAVDGLGVDL